MTDVQVSNARRIKLGATAGFVWSCFLVLLLGLWEPDLLIAVFIICPAIGALFVMLAARLLIKVKKPGAILIGVLLVPICAYALGFFVVLLLDGLIGPSRGIVDGTGAAVPLTRTAAREGYACAYASVTFFAVVMIPIMCLTTVWLEHNLRRTG